ncbi:hypothetical protein [Nocardia sp. XZ_19_369]|uniref:hypothetical protein n=1 Tax=Nocardia sp. XZ_19_369 TaxID=2769487 RepID=UPI00188E15C5|nr:hypothetical protein [Nocardia sp. XZ_19_369]
MVAEGVSEWQNLLDRANAGELALSPDVGRELDAKCEAYLEGLDDVRAMTKFTILVGGFGTMPSGPILEQKFQVKGKGENSIDASIQTHIEEVQLMRQVFAKAIANYQAVDEATAVNIAALDVPGKGGS